MTDVAVTTSADSFQVWADPLTRSGLEPVSLPCLEIVPASDEDLARVRELAGDFDAVVLTSARAVALLWPDDGMPSTPVAAVGEATAAAVEAAGGVVETVGRSGGDALLEGWDGAGRRVLFPHAEGTDRSRLDELGAVVAELAAISIYAARPISPGPDPVDAAVFASPSAVDGWLLSRSFAELRVVGAIGTTTARAIDEAGGTVDAIPDGPSVDALVEAVARALERKP